MIKLVTQFDNPTKQVTVSTPTCCCCCCCCCCLATVASSSAITYMNLKSVSEKSGVKRKGEVNGYAIAGLISLPLIFAALYFTATAGMLGDDIFAIISVSLITWAVMLGFVYKMAGAGTKTIKYSFLTILLTSVVFTGEFFGGLYTISLLGWFYLPLAVAAAFLATRLFKTNFIKY